MSVANLPAEQVVDANKLYDADGIVELFEIHLAESGHIYLKNDNTVTWQSKTYEGLALKLDGTFKDAGDETSRPRLTIANPAAMFSPYVCGGYLDNALFVRYRVLRGHLESNINLYRRETWVISRIISLTQHQVICELRDCLDRQFFVLPARQIVPPEFPAVRLS